MKLQDQVISLKLAKKLKELGVKQESLFCYAGELNQTEPYTLIEHEINRKLDKYDYISAFTVAELFNLIYQIKIDLWIYHNDGKYLVQSHIHNIESNNENLADCLAEILIKTQYDKK